MKKIIPPFSCIMTLVFLCAIAIFTTRSDSARAQEKRTLSPHGQIKVPCNNCHTTEGWKPVRTSPDFNHGSTRFPLQGRHARSYCRDCHVSLSFANAGVQCADCHADFHRRQMGSNCEQCHNPQGWRSTVRTSNQHNDRFPLLGAHASTQCEDCHTSAAVGIFKGLNTQCYSCHSADYLSAKSLNHQANGFSTKCETCHSVDGWLREFDHLKFTGFALVGAHAQLTCLQCHIGAKFTGASADCASCHLQEYKNTKNPAHASSGFPTTCAVCHNTVAWVPASFDHSKTKFPLTGAHATIQCASCHVSGVYAGTPVDCYSCHSKEYNSVTNPNHKAAAFPTNCTQCHTTSSWSGATFTHSKFPIYSGSHAGKWSACTECHPNSADYSAFTCLTCHLKTQTDSRHRGISNYVYNSANCYSCHPRGQSD